MRKTDEKNDFCRRLGKVKFDSVTLLFGEVKSGGLGGIYGYDIFYSRDI